MKMDSNMLKPIADKVMIAGSYALKMYIDRHQLGIPFEVNDVDLFLYNETDKEVVLDYLRTLEITVLKDDANTLSFLHQETAYQLVKPRKTTYLVTYGHPRTLLKYFDFSIVRVAYQLHSGKFYILNRKEFLRDLKDRRLRIKHIVCPFNLVYRTAKYTKKGFHLSMIETMKIFDTWEARKDQQKEIREAIKKLQSSDLTSKSFYEVMDRFIVD